MNKPNRRRAFKWIVYRNPISRDTDENKHLLKLGALSKMWKFPRVNFVVTSLWLICQRNLNI